MYILFANILKYARFILKVMSVSFLATIVGQLMDYLQMINYVFLYDCFIF